MATRGRKAGSLYRFECVECGKVEAVSGGGSNYRCGPCRGGFMQLGPRAGMGKLYAAKQVSRAVRLKELPPASACECVDCGGRAKHYDHRDYNKPLDVEPVCHGCNLRRGPAIPIVGAISYAIENGEAPYTLRVRTAQLLTRLGVSHDVLADMPLRLSVEHWKRIVAHIATQQPAQAI